MCISLGIKHKEFLFEYSMAQILLLVDTWATRQAMMWGGGKKKEEVPRSKAHPSAIPGDLSTAFALKKMMG